MEGGGGVRILALETNAGNSSPQSRRVSCVPKNGNVRQENSESLSGPLLSRTSGSGTEPDRSEELLEYRERLASRGLNPTMHWASCWHDM